MSISPLKKRGSKVGPSQHRNRRYELRRKHQILQQKNPIRFLPINPKQIEIYFCNRTYNLSVPVASLLFWSRLPNFCLKESCRCNHIIWPCKQKFPKWKKKKKNGIRLFNTRKEVTNKEKHTWRAAAQAMRKDANQNFLSLIRFLTSIVSSIRRALVVLWYMKEHGGLCFQARIKKKSKLTIWSPKDFGCYNLVLRKFCSQFSF